MERLQKPKKRRIPITIQNSIVSKRAMQVVNQDILIEAQKELYTRLNKFME